MKHVLVFLLVIAVLAIGFVMLSSLSSPTGFVTAEDENKSQLPDFRLYTKAICTNVSGFVVCHDELFASCGTFEYKLPKNEINGQGVFDEDWKDPRNE